MWGNRLRYSDPNSALAKSPYMSAGDFTFTSQVGYNGTTTVHSPYARVVNFDDFMFSIISLAMLAFQNNWQIIYQGTVSSYGKNDEKRNVGQAFSVLVFTLYLILAVSDMFCMFFSFCYYFKTYLVPGSVHTSLIFMKVYIYFFFFFFLNL